MRTSVGFSLLFLVAGLAHAACSSSSGNGEGPGDAGLGADGSWSGTGPDGAGGSGGSSGGNASGGSGGGSGGSSGGSSGGTSSSGADSGAANGGPCTFTPDCAAGLVCDRTDHECRQCRATADCGAGQRCNAGSCVAAASCKSDLDCQASGLVCDTAGGRCVDCNAAGDCQATQACLGKSCVDSKACTSTKDCPTGLVCAAATPPDWPASFLGKGCQECGASTDCPAGSSCTAGLCFDVCSASGRKCGSYEGATCGACPSSGTCESTGTACESTFAQAVGLGFGGAPAALAETSTAFYVGFRSGSAGLYRVDRATAKTTAVDLAVAYLNGIATNSTSVFYNTSKSGQGTTLMRVPQPTGVPTAVYTWTTQDDLCYEIAADDANVYCMLAAAGADSAWGIYKVALGVASPTPVQLSSGDVGGLRVKKGRVYYYEVNGSGIDYVTPDGQTTKVATTAFNAATMGGMELDDSYVYFAQPDGIYRVPLDGGTPARWVTLAGGTVVGAGGGGVFVATTAAGGSSGGLTRIDTATGALRPVLGAGDPGISPFVVDGSTLWGSPDGSIVRVDLL